jgi:hypothetical protein
MTTGCSLPAGPVGSADSRRKGCDSSRASFTQHCGNCRARSNQVELVKQRFAADRVQHDPERLPLASRSELTLNSVTVRRLIPTDKIRCSIGPRSKRKLTPIRSGVNSSEISKLAIRLSCLSTTWSTWYGPHTDIELVRELPARGAEVFFCGSADAGRQAV